MAASAFSRVGISFCRCTGLLLMNISMKAAVRETCGLSRVFAVFPLGIFADRVDNCAPPDAVAAGNLRRQARQRHQRIHEIGMAFAPEPGVHAAHRRAHHEPQVIDFEAFGEQAIVGLDHVAVAVVRKAGVQPVARPARMAVTDPVGQDEEVPRGIKQLSLAEELAGKLRPKKLPPSPVVPCMIRTALRTMPLSSLCGVPSVR